MNKHFKQIGLFFFFFPLHYILIRSFGEFSFHIAGINPLVAKELDFYIQNYAELI